MPSGLARSFRCAVSIFLFVLSACGGGGGDDGGQSSNQSRVLPPDPGAAGQLTVEGVDANTNGIRDDVERYIDSTFPSSEKIIRALNQYAQVLQRSMVAAAVQDALSIEDSMARAMRCLVSVVEPSSTNSASFMVNDVLARQLNTKARMLAYGTYADSRAGKVVVVDFSSKPCDFDPGTLPN